MSFLETHNVPKYAVNETVRILPYAEDHPNARGRITHVEWDGYKNKFLYAVSNMNQPFQGTLNGHLFYEDELE